MKRFIFNIYLTVKTIDNLLLFILDYCGFVKGDILYSAHKGSEKFIARAGTADQYEIVAVVSGFEYDFTLLPKLVNPIIFDVGAYIGDSAVYINNYFKGKCEIFSIEADKENYRYCKINVLLNKLQNVHCIFAAIGGKNGSGFIQKNKKPTDGYYVSREKSQFGLYCPIRTLADIVGEFKIDNIDVLKMDIEGGEYEIFNNVKSYDFIKNKVKYIFLEYHYDLGEKLVKDLLIKISRDFTILRHRDNLITLENPAIEK